MASREHGPQPALDKGTLRTDRAQVEQKARRILWVALAWAMAVAALTVMSIRTYWVIWPVHELASLALGMAGLVFCAVAAASAARVLWAPTPAPEPSATDPALESGASRRRPTCVAPAARRTVTTGPTGSPRPAAPAARRRRRPSPGGSRPPSPLPSSQPR